MTEEELFIAEKDSRQNYTEQIQYVTVTHTTKAEGRQNKQDAASGRGTARFATAAFAFDELVDYHAKGMTFRKLPESAIDGWSTRFLVMDFDNKAMPDHDPVNVTKQELEQIVDMCQLTARYTHSGDCLDYHWHLFILLDEPVKNADEYTAVRDHTEERLNTALAFIRGRAKLPRLTDPKLYAQTTVFAPKQATARRIVKKTWYVDQDGKLAWGEPPEHLERTIDFPMPRTQSTGRFYHSNLIPLSTSDFARWLVAHGVIKEERVTDIEYDFYMGGNLLKYKRTGCTKLSKPILVGERNATISVFAIKLYAKARSYNLWLAEHDRDDLRFSDEDIVDSFVFYVKDAYVVTDDFALKPYTDMLNRRIYKNRTLSDREYCESVAKYTTGRHQAKTRNYVRDTAQQVVDFFRVDDKVQFGSRSELDRILKEKSISVNTLRKTAKLNNLTVTYGKKGGKGGSRNGSGRPVGSGSVSLESLSKKGKLVDDVFYYTEKLSVTERKFCSLRNIKIKKDDSVKKIKVNKSVKKNSEKIVK